MAYNPADPFGLQTMNAGGGGALPNSGMPFPAPAPVTGVEQGIGPGTPGWGQMWGAPTGGRSSTIQPIGGPGTSVGIGTTVGGGLGSSSASGQDSWQSLLGRFGANNFGSIGQFNLDPQLEGMFRQILGQAGSQYNPNQQYYSGQLTPNLTADDLAAQASMREAAGKIGGNTAPYFELLRNAMGRATGATPSGTLQPAIDATAKDLTKQYTNVGGVRDSTRQQFVGAGQYGSMKQQVAEGINNQGFEDVLAKTIAQMRLGDQQQGAQQADSLLGRMTDMSRLQTMPSQLLSAIGGQNREQQGNLNSEGFNRWAFGLYEPQRQLQNLLNNVSGSLPLGGVNTTQNIVPDWYTELQKNMGSTNLANAQGGSSGGSGSNVLAALLGAGSLWSLFK